ncbi:MAG: hypothetical protein ABFC67_09050, partial [Mizugakiibacter sp.]|uniref:hypothetical protein n=1 Tax=Mizugakiibacter sp. TaxID=1972610 RepID=UPI00320F56BC
MAAKPQHSTRGRRASTPDGHGGRSAGNSRPRERGRREIKSDADASRRRDHTAALRAALSASRYYRSTRSWGLGFNCLRPLIANGDPGTRQAYHTGYLKRDGYLTQTVSGSSPDDSNFRPTTST